MDREPIVREAIPLSDAAADALLILAEAERADATVTSSWYQTAIKQQADGSLHVNLQGNTVAALRRRGLAGKRAGRWRLTAEGRAVVDGQLAGG